ncbi:hypothetical protein [Gimesia panareensis]|uniref:hypothetical protein n=1 Tax=Gimesia panareensis TaxID=2527978 RepID=UPI00118C6C4B|nr:hypothetical protein [Gimesia panareensis]QDU47902.1 hypothetical protein Pan110_02120 [Gimesia panareensis]
MTNHEVRKMEDGFALSRQFAKQQYQSALVMVISGVLAFFVTSVITPGASSLGLAIAAATGFSVGVWCQPNVYRRQNGSLTLAIALIAFMWAVPVIVMLTSFSG